MWAHVRVRHGHILHGIAKRWKLREMDMAQAEVEFTLFNGALAEKDLSGCAAKHGW